VDVSPEVLAALDIIEDDMWAHPERWRGKLGGSQWKIKYALIDAARYYGTMIPTGVLVSLSWRDLAERAGVASSTVEGNIPKMKKVGDIRPDNANRHPDERRALSFCCSPSARTRYTHPPQQSFLEPQS
jgi:hypothetical protein